jgi:UDP-N-acetylmuramoyl-tripeptide--D-alanyl-D-alanine ligase
LAAPHQILTFGLEQPSDVSASYQMRADSSDLSMATPQGNIGLHLAVPGLHNVRNALAATAAALALGIGLDDIKQGLERFSGVKGRLQRKLGGGGAIVIDDTYNANPASMAAAISVLSKHPGRRIFVIGDMGELGSDAAAMHAEIGALAKTAGIDALYAVGALSAEAVQSFGAGARHFDTPEALVAALEDELGMGVALLVKGSRFMRMERVVELLTVEAEKESRHAA